MAHARNDTGEGATAAASGRVTRGEGVAGVERRRGRAGTRGDALSPVTERKQGSRRGAEEEEGEKKPGTDLQNLESSGVYL
jgi:hypothetical protein